MMPPDSCCFSSCTFMYWLLQCSLGWSPSVLGRQTSENPNCAAYLVVRAPPHVHITPILRHLHWVPVRVWVIIGLHASVSTPSPPPPLLISLTFYICTLLLDLFAPVPTPASSKFHSVSARQKVIVLSLTLVLLSGTHCALHIRNATTIDTFKSALKT